MLSFWRFVDWVSSIGHSSDHNTSFQSSTDQFRLSLQNFSLICFCFSVILGCLCLLNGLASNSSLKYRCTVLLETDIPLAFNFLDNRRTHWCRFCRDLVIIILEVLVRIFGRPTPFYVVELHLFGISATISVLWIYQNPNPELPFCVEPSSNIPIAKLRI